MKPFRTDPARVLPPGHRWCVVCDIDGTIADPAHRLHHLASKPKDHKSFHRASPWDKPIPEVVTVFHALMALPNFEGVLVTARPFETSDLTLEWLERWSIRFDHIFVRAAGDFRDDVIVKREILHSMKTVWGLHPYLVIDDRKRVVDMWRSEGIKTLAVADGDF